MLRVPPNKIMPSGRGAPSILPLIALVVFLTGCSGDHAQPPNAPPAGEAPPRFLLSWGWFGLEPGKFNSPDGVTSDARGFVYVADNLNQRIQKFRADGSYVVRWGGLGTQPGEFYAPADVAADTLGFVYVADSNNNRIQKFTAGGTSIAAWGRYGPSPGQYKIPVAIALGSDGNLYVADRENDRIQKLTTEGVVVVTADARSPLIAK